MAHLGSKDVTLEDDISLVAGGSPASINPQMRIQEEPVKTGTYLDFIEFGVLSLTMYTKVLGVLTPGVPVALYLRQTKKLVEIKISDLNSKVVFDRLTEGSENYFAVAFTELDFNALVFDKLTAA